MPPSTSHHTLPPFPDDIPTAPLLTIHLSKLEAGDESESSRFFQACKDLGFFYLDMFGSALGERVVSLAEDVNALQNRWWALPNDVKDQYGRPHLHEFFAYRYGEVTGQYDANGELVRNQNYNVSCKRRRRQHAWSPVNVSLPASSLLASSLSEAAPREASSEVARTGCEVTVTGGRRLDCADGQDP